MPTPTAILKTPVDAPAAYILLPLPEADQDEQLLLDTSDAVLPNPNAAEPPSAETGDVDVDMVIDEEGRPRFAPAKSIEPLQRAETRKCPIPPHRMSPLKAQWTKIYPPLVTHLKLQVRMNIKARAVELRTSKHTTDGGAALQRGADFVRAFALGFDVDDAIALLRLDDLYIESFEVKDIKTLSGDSLARAVGRIAGKDGKTKFAIENASRTRVVLADSNIHILGGFKNIQLARNAISQLVLGRQPGKVHGHLRAVSARMKERF